MISLRPLAEADIPAAAALEAKCFSDAWSERSVRGSLENPACYLLTAEAEGRLTGYLIAQIAAGEGELLRIAVAEDARNKGLGACLLERMLADNPDISPWRLDVREGNAPARALYERFGFHPVTVNRDFYRDPKENGVLMMREVC